MTRRFSRSLAPFLVVLAVVPACTGPDTGHLIQDIVTNVTASDGSVGSRQAGAPPAPNGGPTITATSPGTVTSGGTDTVELRASTPFQTVYASVEGSDGFYQLSLVTAKTDITLTASLGGKLPGSYMASYRAAAPGGLVGPVATVNNTVQAPSQPTGPSVTLTAPADGATITAPATITLSAIASTAGGAITRVDFYAGTTQIGTATTAPYGTTWTASTAGTYALTAKATNTAGLTATSAPVTVAVGTQGFLTGTWVYQGTPVFTFTQTGSTFSGKEIFDLPSDPSFTLTANSAVTGTVSGSTLSGTNVVSATASGSGVSVTCKATDTFTGSGNASTLTLNYTAGAVACSAPGYSQIFEGDTGTLVLTKQSGATATRSIVDLGAKPLGQLTSDPTRMGEQLAKVLGAWATNGHLR